MKISMEDQGTNMKLYYLNFTMVWVYAWLCLVVITFSGYLNVVMEASVLGTTVSCAFAELGLHTGFIVWKSQRENCRKYKDVNQQESEVEEL